MKSDLNRIKINKLKNNIKTKSYIIIQVFPRKIMKIFNSKKINKKCLTD